MKPPVLLPAASWNQPRWRGQRGFYEVYFLKVNLPEQQRALWLRYTLLAPQQGTPIVELWGFYFDHRHPERNWGAKHTLPAAQTNWHARGLPLVLNAEHQLHHDAATGQLIHNDHTLRWTLAWTPPAHGVSLFPSAWLYHAPLPRTKYLSPGWDIRVSGTVQIDEQLLQIAEAPAQQAHLWGTRYADEWVWAHCNAFADHPDAAFEVLHGVVRLAKRPFAAGMLCLRVGKQFYALRRWRACRTFRSASAIGHWQFVAEEQDFRIEGEIEAPPQHLLGARYTDPSGEPRFCHNTKVGSLHLRVLIRSGQGWTLAHALHAPDTCAVEWVGCVQDPLVLQWV